VGIERSGLVRWAVYRRAHCARAPVSAKPVSRIRRAALQTDKLFEISRREVSMMSTLSVMAGFASHRRHNR
jgi:hypothetical protein